MTLLEPWECLLVGMSVAFSNDNAVGINEADRGLLEGDVQAHKELHDVAPALPPECGFLTEGCTRWRQRNHPIYAMMEARAEVLKAARAMG